MDGAEATLNAIRAVESGEDYNFQRAVSVGGERDRKVGAYGVLESKWPAVAESLGYAGADWRDPTVQDNIMRRLLERHYEQLGSWELAATALRFGGKTARALSENGYIEPQAIGQAGLENVAQYMRDLRTRTPKMDSPVAGNLSPEPNQLGTSPNRVRSENIVRKNIVAMRDAQRKRGVSENGSDSEVEPSGNQGIPDQPE